MLEGWRAVGAAVLDPQLMAIVERSVRYGALLLGDVRNASLREGQATCRLSSLTTACLANTSGRAN